jgi:hypothetical protein
MGDLEYGGGHYPAYPEWSFVWASKFICEASVRARQAVGLDPNFLPYFRVPFTQASFLASLPILCAFLKIRKILVPPFVLTSVAPFLPRVRWVVIRRIIVTHLRRTSTRVAWSPSPQTLSRLFRIRGVELIPAIFYDYFRSKYDTPSQFLS